MIFEVKGLKVVFQKTVNDVVNIRYIVNAGSSNEDADSYGTAHFLEHMFFKGTNKRSYKELNLACAKLGDVGAYTSFDQTVYTLSCMNFDLKNAIQTLSEMFFEPAFPKDEFEKEKGVILEENSMYLCSPRGYFGMQFAENIMGKGLGHPIIGYEDSIKETTVEKIKRFMNKNYGRKNMIFAIAGNVNEAYIKKILEEILPDIPEGKFIKLDKPNLNIENFDFSHVSDQAILHMAVKCPVFNEKDSFSLKYLDKILSYGVGGGMYSLLFDRIREELGLCYSIYSYIGDGYFGISTMLSKENIELVEKEILNVLSKVCEKGFSEDLLDTVKKNCIFDMGRSFETSEGLNNYVVSIFDDIPFEQYMSLEDHKNKVFNTTNKDIVGFANTLFKNKVKRTVMTQE